MKLYIILKDGEPYITDRDNKPYVKAYYQESMAIKTAKAFCTSEANLYYQYEEGSYQIEEEGFEYPSIFQERKKRAKVLSEKWWNERWNIKEIKM
jgi:hypothetical protein